MLTEKRKEELCKRTLEFLLDHVNNKKDLKLIYYMIKEYERMGYNIEKERRRFVELKEILNNDYSFI
jgi:hypothetical protein